jgi:sodium/proline symporter
MTRSTAAIVGLCLFGALMIVGALWGTRRTHNAADYLVASRRLNIWLTALSHLANATPAWLLFVVSGVAFTTGLSAVWVAGALFLGTALNWFYVAPRLRLLSAGQGSVSVMQVLGADSGERLHPVLVRSAASILGVSMLLLIGAQLHLLADVFTREFAFGATSIIILISAGVALYLAVGGYWAASLAESVLIIALLAVVMFLPLPAMVAADGYDQLRLAFTNLGPEANDFFGARHGVVAIAFAAGAAGLGLALPGQPQGLSRFIAARDDSTVWSASWLSLGLLALLLSALLACGWTAQVLYSGLANPNLALLALATRILPPGAATILVLIVLGAVAVSIMGQLLVVASLVAADLKRPNASTSITVAHVTTVLAAIVAACFALYAPTSLLDQSLLAFTVLGAAFGPLVLVRVAGKRIRPGAALGAMWAGSILTLLFHWLPDSPGDFLERVLPFVAALGIALSGGERRNNPDRADRAQETVHDRVPI